LRISFDGDFFGETAKDSLQELWAKFVDGKPVSFASDITGITDVAQVMMEEFTLCDVSGNPNRYHYTMALSEYVPPKQAAEEEEGEAGEEEAKEEVKKESEDHDISGKVVDDEEKPIEGAHVVIKGPEGEHRVETDEKGFYFLDDVPEGEYEITVDEEGFEEKKVKVTVEKGKGGGGELEEKKPEEEKKEGEKPEEEKPPEEEEKPPEEEEKPPKEEEKEPPEEEEEKPPEGPSGSKRD